MQLRMSLDNHTKNNKKETNQESIDRMCAVLLIIKTPEL